MSAETCGSCRCRYESVTGRWMCWFWGLSGITASTRACRAWRKARKVRVDQLTLF